MAAIKKPERSQEAFLNHACEMHVPVSVLMLNGDRVEGLICRFDTHSVLIEHESTQHCIAKSSIAMIVPGAQGKANRLGVSPDVRGLRTRPGPVRTPQVVVKKRRHTVPLVDPAANAP